MKIGTVKVYIMLITLLKNVHEKHIKLIKNTLVCNAFFINLKKKNNHAFDTPTPVYIILVYGQT